MSARRGDRSLSDPVLRPATREDEAFLVALYASTREDLAALGLATQDRARLVELQFLAQRQAYRALHPSAERAVVLIADCRVGSVLLDRGVEEIRVVDIAILPQHRGAGVGGRVLERIQMEAHATACSVGLRVAQGSRALALYQRLGFVVTVCEPPYLALRWAQQLD